MGHRRAGKCPTASFSALVIAGGVGGATGGASAAGVVPARGPVVRVHPPPEHELRVPVCPLAVVVELAEAEGLDGP